MGRSKKEKASKKVGKKKEKVLGIGKVLPDVKSDVGDKRSNIMADTASNIVAAAQATGMCGTSITTAVADMLANSSVYAIARTLALKAHVNLPGQAGATDSATVWSPAGLVSYLVWALFDSLRTSGAFQNSAMQGAFPPFPQDNDIPVAWAQVLSYLRPFVQGSVTAAFDDTSLSALPAIPTTATVGVGGISFCLDTGFVVSGYGASAANTEVAISAGTGPASWANVFAFGPLYSNVFSQAMSTCKYGLIPARAPDASAYALPGPSAGNGYSCFTPNFNAEVASLLGVSGATGRGYIGQLGYFKAAPALMGQTRACFWFVETFQLCSFIPGARVKETLATHLWNQAEFAAKASKHGRVLSLGGKSAKLSQPVRYLFGNTIPLDTRAYQALIGYVMSSIVPAGGNTTAGHLYAFGVVAMSALLAKVLPYSYMPGPSTTVTNNMYDPQYSRIALPVALVAVLNTIGPLAVDGRMHYPYLYSAGTDVRGGWVGWSVTGMTSFTGEFFSKICQGTGTGGSGLVIGAFTVSVAGGFAVNSNYGFTPISASADFLNIVANYLQSASTPARTAVNLIKPDSYNPLGKANMLVMADLGFSLAAANQPSVLSTFNTYAVTVNSVGSYKDIAGIELGAAITCPLVYPLNQAGAISTIASINPPYRAMMSGVQRSSCLWSFAFDCNTQEIDNALSQSLALIKRDTREINGITVDVSSNGDLFGAIMDHVVAPLFGDNVSEAIKGSPLSGVARLTTPLFLGGPGLVVADRIGITDGVLSSFGLGEKKKHPAVKAASDAVRGLHSGAGRGHGKIESLSDAAKSFAENIGPTTGQALGQLMMRGGM